MGQAALHLNHMFNLIINYIMAKYPKGILGPITGRLKRDANLNGNPEGGETPRKRKPASPKQKEHREKFGRNSQCAKGMGTAAKIGLRPQASKMTEHAKLIHLLFHEGEHLEKLRLSSGPGPIVRDLRATVDTAARTLAVSWTPGEAGRMVALAVVSADKTYSDSELVDATAGGSVFTLPEGCADVAFVYAFSYNHQKKDLSDTMVYKL